VSHYFSLLTTALAAAITTTGTEEVGAAYAATYPFALLGMVVFSKVLVLVV
jgi:putative transport protein